MSPPSSQASASIFEIAPPALISKKKRNKLKMISRNLPPLSSSSMAESRPSLSKYPLVPPWPTMLWTPMYLPSPDPGDLAIDTELEEEEEEEIAPHVVKTLYFESLIQSLVYEEACRIYQDHQTISQCAQALLTEWLTEDVHHFAYTAYHRHVLQVFHTEKEDFKPWVYKTARRFQSPCPLLCALSIDAWIRIATRQPVLDALILDTWLGWNEEENG